MLAIQYGATSLTMSHFISLKTEISFANKPLNKEMKDNLLSSPYIPTIVMN